jgi:hypothetical protein
VTWTTSESICQHSTDDTALRTPSLRPAEYNMAQDGSPRDTEEPAAPTPGENEPQENEGEAMNRPDDHGDAGLGYDFEVKEQDRWLPIANGECSQSPLLSSYHHHVCLLRACFPCVCPIA